MWTIYQVDAERQTKMSDSDIPRHDECLKSVTELLANLLMSPKTPGAKQQFMYLIIITIV